MAVDGLTRLQRNVLWWLRGREEMPSPRDLLAEFPEYQRLTLERKMATLVRRGLAEERDGLFAPSKVEV